MSSYASLPEVSDLIFMKNVAKQTSIKRNIIVSQYVRDAVSIALQWGVLSVGWFYLPSSQYYLLGLAAPKICEIAYRIQEERDNYDSMMTEFNEIQNAWKTFDPTIFKKNKSKKMKKVFNEWKDRCCDDRVWIEENKRFLNLKFQYQY